MKLFPSFLLGISLALLLSWTSCATLNEVAEVLYENPDPTTSEMSGGLKETLTSGITTGVNLLGKDGGYFNDPVVKIPFPPEAQFVSNTLRDLGMGKMVDDFERKLNQGAEEAAKQAVPIFTNAIKEMSFADVKNILLSGNNTAATEYFKGKTSQQLYNLYSPTINKTLTDVGAAQLWTELTTRYNSIPLINKKVETDLVKYSTDKALDGLFLKVADQEAKIRQDVNARSSDLLKKVFGYADRQMGK